MSEFVPAADATTRFSNRVENYVRYRPGYPPELRDCLASEFGLRPDHVIADVGSGTGFSAVPFVKAGYTVIGVEPNAEMRAAAEKLLAEYPTFRSVAAKAEETSLESGSVDWIIAGQAFHWFDVPRCRTEFARILRPGGRVALFWNVWRSETPLLQDYEKVIAEFAIDYNEVDHTQAEADGRIGRLYGGEHYALRRFPYRQVFDHDGLRGRLCSSSYMPGPEHPRHAAMLARVREIFDRNARDGVVNFDYQTHMYVGEIV